MTEDELVYWLALSCFDKFTPSEWKSLLKKYKSLKLFWQKALADNEKIISGKKFSDFLAFQKNTDLKSFDLIGNVFRLRRIDCYVLTWNNPLYPENLRQIPDSPPVLFIALPKKAEIKAFEKRLSKLFELKALSVVGSRRVSEYGAQVTDQLIEQVVGMGIVIVSGMARGVDSIAHRAALKAGGKTIAVLGSGVDCIYPAESRDIYEKIINSSGEAGIVVSEFFPGTRPFPYNFPRRNRIVSGLSQVLLVTQAAMSSGSMITARVAADQGKEVLAVPGPITSQLAEGVSYLITNGAKLITQAQDILDEYGVKLNQQEIILEKDEEKIYRLLIDGEKYIDDIIRECQWRAERVNSILSIMALKGYIQESGGKWFVKNCKKVRT
jgi:DNA processing protein